MADGSGSEESSREASEDQEVTPPLSELTERIRQKRSSPADDDATGSLSEARALPGEADSLFQEVEVGEIDSERLWAAIESDWPFQHDSIGEVATDSEHVVPKRWYCERCEFFSDPPRVHCNHEGTSIEEFVDTEHVRVRNCPVVAQRQKLGEYVASGSVDDLDE